MWGLDRFSVHSTPSGSPPPQNRSFSPAPRRPGQLGPGLAARPSHSPRSSFLNASGNYDSSNTSLNSQRLPNGSGLKQQITPPAEFTNPLRLLAEIVGHPILDESEDHGGKGKGQLEEKPAELVEDVDFGTLSIHNFLDSGDERGGIGSLESHDNTAQSAMECEYVYAYDIAKFLILKATSR